MTNRYILFIMKLDKFYYDQKINKQLEKILPLFENIHPNIITIFGIILNGIAFYYYFILNNKFVTSVLLILRIVSDNLDGMVARKYNKTSKLGGFLDGIADCILLSTIWYGVFDYIGLKFIYKICLTINCGCILFLYLVYHDAIFIHKEITNDDTLLNKIPLLIYHNTYLSICLVILVIYMV